MSLEESGVSAACFAEVMQLRPDGAHQNHTKSILLPTCIVCMYSFHTQAAFTDFKCKEINFKSFDFSSVICTSTYKYNRDRQHHCERPNNTRHRQNNLRSGHYTDSAT